MEIGRRRTYRRVIVRGERGQTAAETLGALLVVSVIIAAMATTDAGAKIATESQRIVCEIAGGECAPSETQPGGPMEGFEYDGPPLAGQTLPVLPFPGTVTVTCIGRQPPARDVRAQGSARRVGDRQRRDQGRAHADVPGHGGLPVPEPLDPGHAEVRRQRRGQGREDRRPGPGLPRPRLEVPDHGHAEQRRRRSRPDGAPRRTPSTRARSRRARRSSSTRTTSPGIKAKATYREYQLEMGYDTGRRVSSGIKRMDARTVRVMVGDEEFVKQALKLGVKLGDVSAVARQHEGAQRRQAPRDRHRHLDRGRLERLPALHRLGQAAAARLGRHHEPDEGRDRPLHGHDGARGEVGAAHARRPRLLLRGPLDLKTENLATGTTTYTTNVRYNDTSFTLSNDEDANGNPVGTPRYSLMLHDVDQSYMAAALRPHGSEAAGRRPAEDIRIDFTEAELRQLQDFALNRIAERIAMDRRRPPDERGDPRGDGQRHHRMRRRHLRLHRARVGARLGQGPGRDADRALPRWLQEPEQGDRGSRAAHGRPDASSGRGRSTSRRAELDRREVDAPARRVDLLHHHPHRVAEPDPPAALRRRSASSRAR